MTTDGNMDNDNDLENDIDNDDAVDDIDDSAVTTAADEPPSPPSSPPPPTPAPPPSGPRRSRRLALVALVVVVAAAVGAARLLAGGDDDKKPKIPNFAPTDPRTGGMDLSDQPSRGPKDAKVYVIEFMDYSCEFCARHHREVFDQLLAANAGRIRYIVRNFPLTDIHPLAQKAAEAAECAHDQGRFWEYHSRLLRDQEHQGIEDLKKVAKDLKLNTKKFNTCLDEGGKAADVLQDTIDGRGRDIRGTPTFLINGNKLEGAKPLDQFQSAIEQALDPSKATTTTTTTTSTTTTSK